MKAANAIKDAEFTKPVKEEILFDLDMSFWGLTLTPKSEYVMQRAKASAFDKATRLAPSRINVCPFSDFFNPDADEWRGDAWEIMKRTPEHRWVIVTRFSDRIKECLPADWLDGYPNVMLAIQACTQKQLDKCTRDLFALPAKLRGIWVSPMLEAMDLDEFLMLDLGDGGELVKPFQQVVISGDRGQKSDQEKYRPCSANWVVDAIKQCRAASVPVFVQSIGRHISILFGKLDDPRGDNFVTFPGHLKVRELSKYLVPGAMIIDEPLEPEFEEQRPEAPKVPEEDRMPMGDLDMEEEESEIKGPESEIKAADSEIKAPEAEIKQPEKESNEQSVQVPKPVVAEGSVKTDGRKAHPSKKHRK